MNLYSTATSIYCHRTRIVLAEKDIAHECIIVDTRNLPEDLIDLNPYSSLPTLVDRDLVLYNSRVIMEYLEERFPHPPLMPVGPVARAQTRLALFRVEHDWYPLAEIIETKGEKAAIKARKELTESILASADVFAAMPYFLSEEFSLVDASIAPLLWRLPHYQIELPKTAKSIHNYADRLFAREGFHVSLTEGERELRL
ncbi:MAG: stringent starvation protein A [Gammaproteobacteria bacterium]|nr:glutathione S-transferase N-terminal domain-containing protein [Gammaproteobacteria bacterium]NNJ96437.1 stringent starvation protein A [Gammaproteobacteria bacterium]